MIFIYTFHFFSTTIHFVFYIFILFAFCLVCLIVSWIRFCQCSAHVVFDVCLFFMSIIIDLLYCLIVFLIIHTYVIIAFSLRYFLFVESNCLLITTMLIIWTILAFYGKMSKEERIDKGNSWNIFVIMTRFSHSD